MTLETLVKDEEIELLKPSEVAKLLRVHRKTVSRWAAAGKLTLIRTLGGHVRIRKAEVLALMGYPEEGVSEE